MLTALGLRYVELAGNEADSQRVARQMVQAVEQQILLSELAVSHLGHAQPDTAMQGRDAFARSGLDWSGKVMLIDLKSRQEAAAFLSAQLPKTTLQELSADGSLQPVRHRFRYFPLIWQQGLSPPLGVDMGANPVFRKAFDQLMADGGRQLIGPIKLGKDPARFFLIEPREEVQGQKTFALAAFSLPSHSLDGHLAMWFWEGTPGGGRQLVWPVLAEAEFDGAPVLRQPLAATGRQWLVEVTKVDQGWLPGPTLHWQWLLSVCLAVSAVVMTLIVVVNRRANFMADELIIQQESLDDVINQLAAEVSSRERSNQRLRQHEARLQAILDTTSDGVILLNAQGEIELCNPAAEKLFGFQGADLLGRDVSMLLTESFPSLVRRSQASWADTVGGMGKMQEAMGRRAGGELFPFELALSPIEVASSRLYVGVMRDVGDRKRAERLLFESEYKHRAILDAAFIGIFLWQDGRLQYVNPTFLRYFGLPVETPPGAISLLERIQPGFQAQVADLFLAQDLKAIDPIEIECIGEDGRVFPALITGQPIIINQRPGVAGSLLDISLRRQAEAAMRRTQEQNRAILEAIPDLIIQLDRAGRLQDIRSRESARFGLPPESVGLSIEAVLPNSVATRIRMAIDEANRRTEISTFEYTLEVAAEPHVFEGRIVRSGGSGWLLMARDITPRKQIEAELLRHRDHLAEMVRERTAELNTIYESSPLAIAVVVDRHFHYVNPASARLIGSNNADLLGMSTRILYESDEAFEAAGQRIYPALRDGQVFHDEFQFLSLDGRAIWCEMHCKAIDPQNPEAGSVWVVQDVSERHAYQQALLDAKDIAEQANQAKTEFLANMSHELRTPMHAILSFAEIGAGKVGRAEESKIRHYFERIDASGKRLLNILNDLLDLARMEAGKMRYDMRQQSLRPVLEETLQAFASLARAKQIEFRLEVPADSGEVWCDSARIGQVMNNLIANAIRFSPDAGVIQVYMESAVMPEGQAAVRVSVCDQGPGIPNEELESVFDKFIQSSKTKTGAGGTGLGLAICREIISDHGGQISAMPAQGCGACLAFLLPRHPAPVATGLSKVATSH